MLYFGAAEPQREFETRSEIDDASQRAATGRLFTYGYLIPFDAERRQVEWICDVDFWGIVDQATRQEAAGQFVVAVNRYLRRLGKLGRAARVTPQAGPAPVAAPCREPVVAGIAVVTLQTDAIVLSPAAVAGCPSAWSWPSYTPHTGARSRMARARAR